MKSGPITDHDCLFNNLSVHISDKYMQVGIDLRLDYKVLRDELETGILKTEQGSMKALRMLQRWRNSVGEDECTYSVLAAALEKHGLLECAHQYCYTAGKYVYTGNHMKFFVLVLIMLPLGDYVLDYNLIKVNEVG